MAVDTDVLTFELYIMKELKHPNIIEFQKAYIAKKWLLIVTENLENGTLLELLQYSDYSPFEEKEALFIIWNILQALAYLHSQNLIIWNINPSNISIGTSGEIKLGILV